MPKASKPELLLPAILLTAAGILGLYHTLSSHVPKIVDGYGEMMVPNTIGHRLLGAAMIFAAVWGIKHILKEELNK